MLFSDSSVLYFFKRLNNSATLECSVVMMPLPKLHTTAYTFTLSLTEGKESLTVTEENVTQSFDKAEKLFGIICESNTHPSKLAQLAAEINII